jgi:caffeoyl-CoA O-methyltransferase
VTDATRATGEFRVLDAQVERYLDELTPRWDPLLEEMEREAAATKFPIIGPVVGHLCYLLTRVTGARRVFELGSGFGYSTAWFARAVRENGGGEVHHVVWDEELSGRARSNLERMGVAEVVRFTVGEAVEALRASEGGFDVVFNDIDKHAYPEALAVIEEKLRPGGLLIADNLIWHGRIFVDEDRSADTEGIRQFTRAVLESPQWTASIIPIRDGVLVGHFAGAGTPPAMAR